MIITKKIKKIIEKVRGLLGGPAAVDPHQPMGL